MHIHILIIILMSKKFRLSQLELTSDAANRSWLRTTNMTSSTPDTVIWTSFKNVLVNENWEFVVKWSSWVAMISRIHLDSGTLIQGNIYPDYQEQTMTISWDRYRSIELPVWNTTLTITNIKTILHDDMTVRWSFVFNINKNWTSIHTITLAQWTSVLDTGSLSLWFIDWDKLSITITTADTNNTVWAEIFISYTLA